MGSHYTFYTTTFLLMICLGHISLLLLTAMCILLMVTQYSKLCITMIYQSSTDRHLGCTNIFVINNAELNMSLYVCLCALVVPVVRHKSRMVGSLGTPVFKSNKYYY